jgi:hypothetical protein
MKFIRTHGVILTLAALVLTIYGLSRYRNRPLPFDSAKWKAATRASYYEPRFRMINDVKRMFEDGRIKTTRDALQHLGPPGQGAQPPFGKETTTTRYTYNLGPEHNALFPVDNDWLHIYFDLERNTTTYTVCPD